MAASDGTKHEVKALQRRLLAAQVDARVGWQEVQKLHLARMERMEAAVGGFNRREETLLRELNECRVQLEIETREHARLRETHREVTAEAAAGVPPGRGLFVLAYFRMYSLDFALRLHTFGIFLP